MRRRHSYKHALNSVRINIDMAKLVLINKPYDVLCQFTDGDGRQTLADYINDPALNKVYPAGRLDRDSEGLVLLTDNGRLQHQIAHPSKNKFKTYWVQVEGDIHNDAVTELANGVALKDGLTKPARVKKMAAPELWPRSKPVRFRANIPTSWLCLSISEGKNRQVRRMTAAVGFPTLRLIRFSVDQWNLQTPVEPSEASGMLQPGQYICLNVDEAQITHEPKAKRPAYARKTRSTVKNKHKRSKPKS